MEKGLSVPSGTASACWFACLCGRRHGVLDLIEGDAAGDHDGLGVGEQAGAMATAAVVATTNETTGWPSGAVAVNDALQLRT